MLPEELQLGTALEQPPEAVDVEIGVVESKKPQLGQRDLPAAATVEGRKYLQVRAGFEQRIVSVEAKGAVDAECLSAGDRSRWRTVLSVLFMKSI